MNRLSSRQSLLLRTGARLASPGGRNGSLLVLMFHRVLAQPDPLLPDEPDAASFAAQMDLVADLFNVLSLAEAVERLQSKSLPPRAVAITFDDGYANNLAVAAPILAARGLTATFFVTTGFIDGGRMWNDTVIEAMRHAPRQLDVTDLELGMLQLSDDAARRKAVDDLLPRLKYLEPATRLARAEELAARAGVLAAAQPMMTERQLRELAALGMEIGAHCVTHPILARLPHAAARLEICASKERLESVLGTRVRTFAYPNGRPGTDYAAEHVALVRDAGYMAAVSTAWGAATARTDRHQLPRVAPWDSSAVKYGLRMLRAFTERRPRSV